MECLYCKAQMRRGTAPFSIDRNGYHVSWDAIPAWVCDQCGESLFETHEVDVIQEALSVLDRETVALVGQSSR
jgi:YgiT-type zinc finger domain-containing protein